MVSIIRFMMIWSWPVLSFSPLRMKIGTTPFRLTKLRNKFSIVLSKTKISDQYYDHHPKLLGPLFSFRYRSKYSNEVIGGGYEDLFN